MRVYLVTTERAPACRRENAAALRARVREVLGDAAETEDVLADRLGGRAVAHTWVRAKGARPAVVLEDDAVVVDEPGFRRALLRAREAPGSLDVDGGNVAYLLSDRQSVPVVDTPCVVNGSEALHFPSMLRDLSEHPRCRGFRRLVEDGTLEDLPEALRGAPEVLYHRARHADAAGDVWGARALAEDACREMLVRRGRLAGAGALMRTYVDLARRAQRRGDGP